MSVCGCRFGQGATPEKHPSRGKRRRGERARCSVWTKPSVRPAAQGVRTRREALRQPDRWDRGGPSRGAGVAPGPTGNAEGGAQGVSV